MLLGKDDNDLAIVNAIRDFYIDCGLPGHEADVLYWAEKGAKLGGEKEKEEYSMWKDTFSKLK